ncbi:uncharacterized protein V1516DRAFT_669436 [Lipomyces oligophaga]|uniref:uncharacterized protein n=1 Tax=Lipomyces oligophaga TaxID=45792 RepID=UPI0034CF82C5
MNCSKIYSSPSTRSALVNFAMSISSLSSSADSDLSVGLSQSDSRSQIHPRLRPHKHHVPRRATRDTASSDAVESYILATPPPRITPSKYYPSAPLSSPLLFQIQMVSGRAILPILDIRRTSKLRSMPSSPKSLCATSPPSRSSSNSTRHRRRSNSNLTRSSQTTASAHKKSHDRDSRSQFKVYSCESTDTNHRSLLAQALDHTLQFRHSGKLEWRIVRESASSENIEIISLSCIDPSPTLVGRWIPKSSTSTTGNSNSMSTSPSSLVSPVPHSFDFISADGTVLAHLRKSRVDILASAERISCKGYIGCFRFEEAIAMSAIYIAGSTIFGPMPLLSSLRPRQSSQTVSPSSHGDPLAVTTPTCLPTAPVPVPVPVRSKSTTALTQSTNILKLHPARRAATLTLGVLGLTKRDSPDDKQSTNPARLVAGLLRRGRSIVGR